MIHNGSIFDGSNNWKQNFVWNDEIDGIEMLEQKDLLDYDTDGNTTEVTRSFYHRNALGSVMEITDANQVVAVSYRYDPYGKVTITRGATPQTSDPLGQHWTFTGRFLDEESGLMYYRARYYDPGTGRFLERDPLGYATGANMYSYASSSPSANVDPSGLRDGNSTIEIDGKAKPPEKPTGPEWQNPFQYEEWMAETELDKIYEAQNELHEKLKKARERAAKAKKLGGGAAGGGAGEEIKELEEEMVEGRGYARDLLALLATIREARRRLFRGPTMIAAPPDPRTRYLLPPLRRIHQRNPRGRPDANAVAPEGSYPANDEALSHDEAKTLWEQRGRFTRAASGPVSISSTLTSGRGRTGRRGTDGGR